ncbi:MAG: C40 family peptidase [Candidatus Woesearchaeota archaeon]
MKLLIIILILVFVLTGCEQNINFVTVSEKDASRALKLAEDYKGLEYKLGGREPPEFDCSGLITYSYKEVLGKQEIFYNGNEIVDDATMDNLYNYNTQPIPPPEVKPGDIVFITKEKDKITHGGLFVEWIEKYEKFKFINASSYRESEEVVISEWKIDKEKRGQWFEGFGRLKIAY